MEKNIQEKRLREKVQTINSLLKQLKLGITAVQKIDSNGYIQNVVVYSDMEQYPIEPIEDPRLPDNDNEQNEKTTDIQ